MQELQERLFQQHSDFKTSHAQVEERIASLKEQLKKAQQANKESSTLASVSASQEEEIVKDLLDKLNKSKASNQELTTLQENDRVSTQKRMLMLEEQVAKASQSMQSTNDAKMVMESQLEALKHRVKSQQCKESEEMAQLKTSVEASKRHVQEICEENQKLMQRQDI
jgi:hypothetical protein